MTEEDDKKQQYETEKKSDFIGNIVKSFSSFVSTFKEHGLLYTFIVMFGFMVFYSFILNPVDINKIVTEALQSEKRIEMEHRDKSIQQRLRADAMINGLMNDIIEQFDVNRCILLEASNGSSSLSGVEFTYINATAEVIGTNDINGEEIYDLDYQADNFQKNHIVNLFGETVWRRMKLEKYLYFPHLETYNRQSYRFLHKMKTICKSESVMLIPFLADNIPVVILVISSREPTIPADKIYSYVEKFRPEIERYLMNVD